MPAVPLLLILQKSSAFYDLFPHKNNQIELSPYLQNRKVVDWAKKAIAALDCNDRLVSPEGLAPEWD
ncbi:hypothetical protein ACEXEL_002566 [Citrobacter koseri]|nr:hypothetical protein [Citrobacter koseri]MBJ8934063.1 hypothetical protein [Citrobacter koseri]HEM7999015.1 hypothetical protein [Citrobacter koseri]HEM8560093.1 hypothetical protein [Citrobacter koseri]